MNKTKKGIISVLLTFIMIVTVIASVGISTPESANALNEWYFGQGNTIYYFADSYYPEVREEELSAAFPNHEIVYDFHSNLDSDTLESLYEEEYFEGFAEDCIVVFELTVVHIESYVLEAVFEAIKEQGVVLIFVGTCDACEYDFDIFEYVDDYVQVTGNSLHNFVRESVADMADNGLYDDSCIILDGKCVAVYSSDLLKSYADIQAICEVSLLLRWLLQELADFFELSYGEDYNKIAQDLYERGFSIIVYVEENIFIDLLAFDWEKNVYDEDDYYDIYEMTALISEQYGYRQFFAIGFWELSYGFLIFILDVQYGYDIIFPVYIYEIQSVSYDDTGIYASVFDNSENRDAVIDSISRFAEGEEL